MSPQPGSGGPAYYRQPTTPTQGAPGDSWFDGIELRTFDAVNGWVLPGGSSGNTQALSQSISVLSQQVSVMSAGLGGVQMQVVGGIQGVSSIAAGGIAISGLSASVTSAATYRVEGLILYQMSAADAFGVALTFPAGTLANFELWGANAMGVSAPLTATGNEDASGSIVYSAIVAVATSTLGVHLDGQFVTSATAGTIQVLARVSATTKPANIQRGSFLRAYKLA